MRRTSAFISAFALMLTMVALPAPAEEPVYSPALGEVHTGPGGNCNDDITIDGETFTGAKLDDNPRGTFPLADGVSITVTANSVTANGGTAILCIKGSDTNSGTVVIGTGQTVAYTAGGISNIVWYRVEAPPIFPEGTLSVVKTASGDYDRTVTWDIDKTVDPDLHRLLVGESADSGYEVDVTKSELVDNYRVSGTIVIGWSGSTASVSITSITDSIAGATFICPGDPLPTSIDPGQTLECTYTAPGAVDVTSNTVEVSGSYVIPDGFQDAGQSVAVGSEDTAGPFGYTENLIGFDTVDVVDAFDGGAATALGTTSADALFEYDRTFTCSERGTFTFPDTATIVQTDQSDSALVTVECVAALEACTPGFWGGTRNSAVTPANLPAWSHLASEHSITPTTTLASVGLTGHGDLTFDGVFNTRGRNNHSGSLVWHAAAAYLNATMAGDGLLDFPMAPSDVVERYLDGDKESLANANEDGECPFGANFPSAA